MVEFKIHNQDQKDVLSYTDYKADGSNIEGQVKNPINDDILDPELFLKLFQDKRPAESYERANSYNDAFQRLYTFNPEVASSTNAVKISVSQDSYNYDKYCNQLDDITYGVNLENSKEAKNNHLVNFKSAVAMVAIAGIAISSIAFGTLIADHHYDIGETIDALENSKSVSEINTMQTTNEAFNQMVDDGEGYHAARR